MKTKVIDINRKLEYAWIWKFLVFWTWGSFFVDGDWIIGREFYIGFYPDYDNSVWRFQRYFGKRKT